ncbi:GNAT family N-acetyltransferase [Tissierella sp.]|uniref:GNAT family N-acetyltransferase n=1 Tax=Tissierella sp. TaxID=41274 RepID=UPI00285D1F1D|nr:GNAT family N-acetyltransferase [Tissierella sp.]MDR7857853.1 GNAT family N-acetyltransferase [Tissierella sp.]
MIKKVASIDINDAGLVYSKAWQASHRGIVSDDFLALHTPQRQGTVILQDMDKGNDIYIYYKDQLPIGILNISISNNEIVSLYFVPEFWGKGDAQRLLEFGIQQLNQDNQIFLIVMNLNARARRFYEKHGFVFSGEEKLVSTEKGISELRYIYI